jgi:hypothetical protein
LSIEQQRQDALDDLDELLSEGTPTEQAITDAATANGLKPEVLLSIALKRYGDLEDRRDILALRKKQAQRERDSKQHEKDLREIAGKAAERSYYACLMDDPIREGQPVWSLGIGRIIDELGITERRYKDAVSEGYYSALRRLDRKHRTKAADRR